MALLERVSTLLRANLNDLVEKAEDPERLLKQIVLDMENQLLQVKTQVAIAIADQHLLEKKRAEHEPRRRNGGARRSLRWRRAMTTWPGRAGAGSEPGSAREGLHRRRPRIRSMKPTICARPCASWTRS